MGWNPFLSFSGQNQSTKEVDTVRALKEVKGTHMNQEKITHLPHPFFVCHWIPEGRGIAAFAPASSPMPVSCIAVQWMDNIQWMHVTNYQAVKQLILMAVERPGMRSP